MKNIPSIIELNEDIANDLRSKLGLTDDDLKKVVNALPLVLSGQFKLSYLFLGDIQDNCFPDKASTELNGGTLERQGRIYLNRNPFPDSIGVFKLSVTGIAGSILRSDLTFKSNDDALNAGQVYVLDTEYTLTGTADEIEVRSIGSGVDYNLSVGNNLTITEPVIGVDKTVTVSEVVTQPTAGETEELYRQAILNAIQLEPQGGAKSDYRIWSGDAQGVRLIYPYVRDGEAGTVDIYVEATLVDSEDGKGTPGTAILNAVADVIDFDPDVTKPDYERARRYSQSKQSSSSKFSLSGKFESKTENPEFTNLIKLRFRATCILSAIPPFCIVKALDDAQSKANKNNATFATLWARTKDAFTNYIVVQDKTNTGLELMKGLLSWMKDNMGSIINLIGSITVAFIGWKVIVGIVSLVNGIMSAFTAIMTVHRFVVLWATLTNTGYAASLWAVAAATLAAYWPLLLIAGALGLLVYAFWDTGDAADDMVSKQVAALSKGDAAMINSTDVMARELGKQKKLMEVPKIVNPASKEAVKMNQILGQENKRRELSSAFGFGKDSIAGSNSILAASAIIILASVIFCKATGLSKYCDILDPTISNEPAISITDREVFLPNS